LKRVILLLAAVVVGAACPADKPASGCNDNADCDGDAVCSAGNCVTATAVEGEGEVGGEGEVVGEGEGEGEEGEGEGEGEPPPPPPRLEIDVVAAPGGPRHAGNLTLTGGPVTSTPTHALRGARFTLRAASVGGAL
jgi:hypothetical protein